MKKLFITMFLLLGLQFAAQAHANVKIFACEPEWASLASEIAKDKAEVYSATHYKQDVHYLRAKPGLLAKMRNSDLVICSGADLEVGWLPILLQKAGSNQTQPGQIGNLMAANYVRLIEIPQIIDRSLGDIHPQGNPHVHLNPNNLIIVAKELTKRLKTIDKKSADFYQGNFEKFSTKFKENIKKWQEQAVNLKDLKVIVHHRSFSYLLNWLGIKQIASLEPKPGIPPSITHLEKIINIIKENNVNKIILAPHEQTRAASWVHEKTGIKVITLPYTIGGDVRNLDELFTATIKMLEQK